jgi:eukaryotic-like serine/threonine-protein kinase
MSDRTCPKCGTLVEGDLPYCPNDGTVLLPPDEEEDTLIGTLAANRYKVQKRLGEGGMGEVYMAEHVAIEKRIALKVLRLEYSQKSEVVARFLQEAKSASRIKHPNVVDVFDFGQLQDGRFFLALEFLNGNDLAEELRQQGQLPPGRIIPIMLQVCRALSAAHASGVVHRDLKPENIFLNRTDDGEESVKLVDFGIAQMRDIGDAGTKNPRLTKAGTIFGTPEYMAPEQAGGKDTDLRSDVYAIGIILYELFAGTVPFVGTTLVHTLTMHLSEPPKPVSSHGRKVSPELEAVIAKAIAKSPNDRFQTIGALAEALLACPESAGISRRSMLPSMAERMGSAATISIAPPDPNAAGADGTGAHGVRAQTASGQSLSAITDAPRAPKKNFGPIGVGVGILVAAGAAAAFFATRPPATPVTAASGEATSPTAPSAVATADSSAAPGTAPGTPPAGSQAVVVPAGSGTAPTIAPVPDDGKVRVQIETDPPGAAVKNDGFAVCASTPCELTVKPGEKLVLTAEKGDLRGELKVQALQDDTFKIALAKRVAGKAPAAGKKAPPGGGGGFCETVTPDGLKTIGPCK